MLVHVPGVLKPSQVDEIRRTLNGVQWIDGKNSAGMDAAAVKNNQEVSKDHPALRGLSETVIAALMASPRFGALALPVRIVPPMFSRYQPGQGYGVHADGAMFHFNVNGMPLHVRGDMAGTLFLNNPDEYDGGELMVHDSFGVTNVKLPAGDAVLYPASSLHHVAPVTRGHRLVSFFWVQSMVRSDEHRTQLEALDTTIRDLRQSAPGNPAIMRLVSLYHNLLRMWGET